MNLEIGLEITLLYREMIIKDVERQKEIIEHLRCKFYRIKERDALKWKTILKKY